MEASGTAESMLAVPKFVFADSAIFAQVCYIFCNAAHLGKHNSHAITSNNL